MKLTTLEDFKSNLCTIKNLRKQTESKIIDDDKLVYMCTPVRTPRGNIAKTYITVGKLSFVTLNDNNSEGYIQFDEVNKINFNSLTRLNSPFPQLQGLVDTFTTFLNSKVGTIINDEFKSNMPSGHAIFTSEEEAKKYIEDVLTGKVNIQRMGFSLNNKL